MLRKASKESKQGKQARKARTAVSLSSKGKNSLRIPAGEADLETDLGRPYRQIGGCPKYVHLLDSDRPVE